MVVPVAVIIVIILIVIYMFRKGIRTTLGYMGIMRPTLYERLGGVYAIAGVINHFSDALISNPIVGKDSPNEKLRDWHRNQLTRLPGLKFMRTLWVCDQAGGPYSFIPTVKSPLCPFTSALTVAHSNLGISVVEFDEVANELERTLDHFNVPLDEKRELLSIFAGHKGHIVH